MTKIGWIRFKPLDGDAVLVLVVFRVLNALCAQTYFVPDEYWQGPEVSHRLVFGYGLLRDSVVPCCLFEGGSLLTPVCSCAADLRHTRDHK